MQESSYTLTRRQNRKSLFIAFGITVVFFLIELTGGYLTNSLALLSDAGHMFTDVLALGMSLLAMRFATRPPTQHNTFGFHRLEIFAALANGLTLVGISIYIFIESYHRFLEPQKVAGLPMLLVAISGLVANMLSGYFLHRSRGQSLNIKGAYLHVLGDALGSIGAITAGVIMWQTGWMYADPLFSLLIGVIIIISSVRLLRETVHVLMQGTPAHIDINQVRAAISHFQDVIGIHDLHIWTLTNGIEAMTLHVNVDENISRENHDVLIKEIRELSRSRFGIEHTTVQIELVDDNEHDCIVSEPVR